MAKFNAYVLVMGSTVFGDQVEAATASEARSVIESLFWKGAEDLRSAMTTMNEMNRSSAEIMAAHVDKMVDNGRRFGITVEARRSRAA